MGDPICKWRNASVETLIELVSQLPKKRMTVSDFRLKMADSIYGGAFLKTAYQLASQLGLYYVDDVIFHPRFDHNLTITEAKEYLAKWVYKYYVPNPYTAKKFEKMEHPIFLMNSIAEFVKDFPELANLATACNSLFGESTGNLLCVKYMLTQHTDNFEIDQNFDIHIKKYPTGPTDVFVSRYDKKAFFDTFNY